MACGDRDLTVEQRWFGIQERLRQEAYFEDEPPLSDEELDELRARFGWTKPSSPPRDPFELVPPLTELERRFLAGRASSQEEAERAVETLVARASEPYPQHPPDLLDALYVERAVDQVAAGW